MSSEVSRMSANGSNMGIMQNSYTGGSMPDDTSNSETKPNVSIFSSDYKKHDDLKQMLDSNKDSQKLEAMKRIIGMIAKGKNASDLFPAVVKNVVSKNVEIKKLVYVYLMRYAEEQQDLALLSISTFQRALKDPNQLIRASALRVLSSIRVPIIVTIMMLAIKEAVVDMSPFVRKTAAIAISKLYSLDPDLKEDLIAIIEKLLSDKTILVVGSAINTFEEVCPERIDLIHKNYRKLCNLLIDVDEWGQVAIINMLTRYARTQFLNPGPASEYKDQTQEKKDKDQIGVEKSDDSDEDDYNSKFNLDENGVKINMDPDHRLLIKNTKPLFQSRNSAVVMAVAQLYYYVAPKSEVQIVAKSLIRLLKSYREVQIIVLKCIVSMAQRNKQLFQNNIKSFFVHANDGLHVKLLKLEILTCLANETNISNVLREFQTYVLSNDKMFAAASIHAIGRCASNIKEVSDNCLSGLVNLMSKKDETIVAESVVVIKRLLQLNPSKNDLIIKRMAKMTDKITVPMARASILWLIGEYSDRLNKIAPDILRKSAKTFCEEENVVKLQIINLAVKLHVSNPKQVALLVQYVLNLAKYDQNYDIRDRARYFRALIYNNEKCPMLAKHLKKILIAPKPAPVLESIYKDSDQFEFGTLSHAINSRVSGYSDLPDFPAEAPDTTVRNVEVAQKDFSNESGTSEARKGQKTPVKAKKSSDKFYSDEESDSQSTEGADPTNDEDENEDDESDGSDDSEDGSDTEENTDKTITKKKVVKSRNSDEEEEESSSDDSEESSEDSDSDSDKEVMAKQQKITPVVKQVVNVASKKKQEKSEDDDSESNTESSSSNESDSESDSESESEEKSAKVTSLIRKDTQQSTKVDEKNKVVTTAKKEVSLLDLDFSEPLTSNISSKNLQNQAINTQVLSPSLLADLANLSSSNSIGNFQASMNNLVISKKEYDLLNKMNSGGLQITYVFPRTPNIASNKMTTVELIFKNFTNGDLTSLAVVNKKLQTGMSISEFSEIDLVKNGTARQAIGIDFNDTTQACQFELSGVYSNDPSLGGTSLTKKWSNLAITCPIGEILTPGWSFTENEFNKQQAKLKGMNEVNANVNSVTHALFLSRNLNEKLLENFNVCQIPSSQQDLIKYAALTTSGKSPLLLSLYFNSEANSCQLNVNCEKIVIASMFIKEVKQMLTC